MRLGEPTVCIYFSWISRFKRENRERLFKNSQSNALNGFD